MSFRISILASAQLQATVLLLKGMDRELASQVRKAIKTITQSEWQEAVRGRTQTALQVRVLSDTARVTVSDQNITLKSATIGKSLSGGLKPSDLAHNAEFGADRKFTRSYTATSSKGKKFEVKNRHTRKQFSARNLKGHVVYPAAAKIIPRIAALYVQTTVRTFHELIEKGQTRG